MVIRDSSIASQWPAAVPVAGSWRPLARRLAPALVVGLALAVAAITLAFGSTPRFDPRGWLRWGHELTTPGVAFSTAGYPSWKPLPVLFTVPLALTGGAAPALWLILARASGVVAVALVFREARRLAGERAAVIAALSVVVMPGWLPTWMGGQIEPLLLVLALLAIDRHRAGRPGQALGLGALVALGRPEAWPLLAAYAAVVVARDRRRLGLALLVLACVPLLWVGGDWLGAGHPLHGGVLAREAQDAVAQRRAGDGELVALAMVGGLLVAPLWLALAAGVIDALRRRQPLALAIAAGAGGWLAIDVLAAGLGYPATLRFMLPAGGALGIVAGAGAGRLLDRLTRPETAPASPTVPLRIAPAWAGAELPRPIC